MMAANKFNLKNLLLAILFFPSLAHSQETLMIEGTAGNLYLTHTTAAKENFYSVGRLYNISPKEIAPYNNLTLENGIAIGQTIKIPLRPVNFTQTAPAETDEITVPLYHKVEPKETLYQLSTHYNKVPVTTLKSWNNISADAVTPGQDIIIGYLKVKKDISALSKNGLAMPAGKISKKQKKDEEAKEGISKEQTIPVNSRSETEKANHETVKEKAKTEIAEPVKAQGTKDFKGGIFKSMYSSTGKEENGVAGVFKSTSGWDEGKYYCLHNAAQQGTIVKITNTATGKAIYAKVLDVMPDLTQNNALAIRISNAAADALGAGPDNFNCLINY